MRSSILKRKISKTKIELKNIITKYNSKNNLKKLHAIYEKQRHSKHSRANQSIDKRLKIANYQYLKTKRLLNRIKKMNQELLNIISDESSCSHDSNQTVKRNVNEFVEEDENNNEITQEERNTQNDIVNEEEYACLECANCKRCQNMLLVALYGEESPYCMKFSFIPSTAIGQRKFTHPDIVTNDSDIEYPLCTECGEYLTRNEKYQTEEFCWPSFICKLLTNEKYHRIYGCDLWRMIPREFRFWWLLYLKEKFPHIFSEVSP